jgi:hypothetical protein
MSFSRLRFGKNILLRGTHLSGCLVRFDFLSPPRYSVLHAVPDRVIADDARRRTPCRPEIGDPDIRANDSGALVAP